MDEGTGTPGLEESLMALAFGEICDTSREVFARLGRHYEDGAVLFAEGDGSSDLFIILRGRVRITVRKAEGPVDLAVLADGEIFGEMSHFDDEPRSATAQAVGPCDLLVLSRENFGLIFQLHPKWTNKLVVGLSSRIAKALETLDAGAE